MPDKTIKHFISVQFFNWQNPNYPHDIFDVNFLSSQLPLTQHMFRSLENQTNKNFEVIVRLHKNHFSGEKYKPVLSALKNATTLPIKFATTHESHLLVAAALQEYDCVITSRMDFDDFVYKDAVDDTQNKARTCNSILLYGYCKGYTYVYGELYPHKNLWGGIGHLGIMQSLIVDSAFAKEIPFLVINSFSHNRFKSNMKEFFEKNNVEFSESMFEQNTSTDAYIYYRHEFSQELLKRGKTKFKIPEYRPLTSADITKKQLEEEFGFYCDLKSIK